MERRGVRAVEFPTAFHMSSLHNPHYTNFGLASAGDGKGSREAAKTRTGGPCRSGGRLGGGGTRPPASPCCSLSEHIVCGRGVRRGIQCGLPSAQAFRVFAASREPLYTAGSSHQAAEDASEGGPHRIPQCPCPEVSASSSSPKCMKCTYASTKARPAATSVGAKSRRCEASTKSSSRR